MTDPCFVDDLYVSSNVSVTETAHIPPYSRIRREAWSGCHGGAEAETMTMTTGPEDHPRATT